MLSLGRAGEWTGWLGKGVEGGNAEPAWTWTGYQAGPREERRADRVLASQAPASTQDAGEEEGREPPVRKEDTREERTGVLGAALASPASAPLPGQEH